MLEPTYPDVTAARVSKSQSSLSGYATDPVTCLCTGLAVARTSWCLRTWRAWSSLLHQAVATRRACDGHMRAFAPDPFATEMPFLDHSWPRRLSSTHKLSP
jgi:hypothetical protein